jgi:hypothetical protein
MHVVNVVGGSGEESMAAAEMKADAICRNGELWVVAITCFFLEIGGFFSLSPFHTPSPPGPPRQGGPVHVLSLDDRQQPYLEVAS